MARDIQHTTNPWDARRSARGAGTGTPAGTITIVVAAAALVLLAAVVYWNGVRGEFLGPDHALYQHSPLLEPPASSGAAAALPGWLPRAVTTSSLVIDRSIWGPLPSGYRASPLMYAGSLVRLLITCAAARALPLLTTICTVNPSATPSRHSRRILSSG